MTKATRRWTADELRAISANKTARWPTASPATIERLRYEPRTALGPHNKGAAQVVSQDEPKPRQARAKKPTPHDFVADLIFQIKACGLPLPTREYAFAKPRRWRFDCAYILEKIAVEVEGAVWTEGRHTRGSGFVADIEKYNEATLRGWRLLRVTTDQVTSGVALNLVDRAWLEFKPA